MYKYIYMYIYMYIHVLTARGISEIWFLSRFSIVRVGILNSDEGMASSMLSYRNISVTEGRLERKQVKERGRERGRERERERERE